MDAGDHTGLASSIRVGSQIVGLPYRQASALSATEWFPERMEPLPALLRDGRRADREATVTYLAFHLCFILPPILLLMLIPPRPLSRVSRWSALALPLMALIALVYTTPWDNFLIWMGVWQYDADRVIATLGYVPVEEYAFFLLQPLLTGLWLYRLSATTDWARVERGPLRERLVGAAVWVAIGAAAAVAALRWDTMVYLGLILGWTMPVVGLQWGWGGGVFSGIRRVTLLSVTVPTLYLWVVDRIAIGLGIWEISPHFTTGIDLAGLPLEEAVFFLMTNIMVVQGLLGVRWLDARLIAHRQPELIPPPSGTVPG